MAKLYLEVAERVLERPEMAEAGKYLTFAAERCGARIGVTLRKMLGIFEGSEGIASVQKNGLAQHLADHAHSVLAAGTAAGKGPQDLMLEEIERLSEEAVRLLDRWKRNGDLLLEAQPMEGRPELRSSPWGNDFIRMPAHFRALLIKAARAAARADGVWVEEDDLSLWLREHWGYLGHEVALHQKISEATRLFRVVGSPEDLARVGNIEPEAFDPEAIGKFEDAFQAFPDFAMVNRRAVELVGQLGEFCRNEQALIEEWREREIRMHSQHTATPSVSWRERAAGRTSEMITALKAKIHEPKGDGRWIGDREAVERVVREHERSQRWRDRPYEDVLRDLRGPGPGGRRPPRR